MSGLQFTIDIIRAIAWPVAVVVLIVVLRRPIAGLLAEITSGLRRLRAGQTDAETERISNQVRAELAAAATAAGPGPAGMPALLRFAVLAEDDPSAAIVQGYASLELALRDLLAATGKLQPTPGNDPAALARFARDQGLIPESLVRAIDEAGVLRGRIAGDPGRAQRGQALTFLALIDAALQVISVSRERARAPR